MTRLQFALSFATAAHEGQTRRFTGEPYINHCIRVRERVASYGLSEDAQIAALLHDTLEDQAGREIRGEGWMETVNENAIKFHFGKGVLRFVLALTKSPDDSFQDVLDYLSEAPPEASAIKCADRADNLRDATLRPSYIEEARAFASLAREKGQLAAAEDLEAMIREAESRAPLHKD